MGWLYGALGKDKNYVQDFQSASVNGRHLHRWECNIDMDPSRCNLFRCGLDSFGSGEGPVMDCCEGTNGSTDSTK
jgi:hypothetical protein